MKTLYRTAAWCAPALAALIAAPAPAQFVTSFGPDGTSGRFYPLINDQTQPLTARAVRRDSARRVWLLQDWDSAQYNQDCAVQRHILNGLMPDMSFAVPTQLAYTTGFTLEATKRLDFDVGGTYDDTCYDLELTSNNKAYVVGSAATNNLTTGIVGRLNEDGSWDTSFSGDGKTNLYHLGFYETSDVVLKDSVVLNNDGVAACGFVQYADGERDMVVVVFREDGTLDPAFSGDGVRSLAFDLGGDDSEECTAIALLPDGKLLLGGFASDGGVNNSKSFAIARVLTSGSLDTSFSVDGKASFVVNAAGSSADDRAYDLEYDQSLQRAYLIGDSNLSGVASKGVVLAVNSAGNLDTTFGTGGEVSFRFSDRASGRGAGATMLKRGALDGSVLYVVGNHTNTANTSTYGGQDIGVAALESTGSFRTSFGTNGVFYGSFGLASYGEIPSGSINNINESIGGVDLTNRRLTLAFSANRHPAAAATADYPAVALGPMVPALAQLSTGSAFESAPAFNGVPAPDIAGAASIAVPAGYGRYCSVRNRTTGTSGLGFGTITQDPCATMTAGDPNAVIERAGVYSLNGQNQALHVCAHSVDISRGTGMAPINAVFNTAGATDHCVFTITPQYLRVFEAPYGDGHVEGWRTGLFPHTYPSYTDGEGAAGFNVTHFDPNATPNLGHFQGHLFDYLGRNQCSQTVDTDYPHPQARDMNELAIDLLLPEGRDIESMAAGIVLQAAPRYVIGAALTTGDAWQREVFIGHRVGSGEYAEEFVSYYAHMKDTRVRIGQAVYPYTVLGKVGNTGSSRGIHLHYTVMRYNNLSFRRQFRFNFDRRDWCGANYDCFAAAVDPYGWLAPSGNDPWAWYYRDRYNGRVGAFSTHLWLSGHMPPTE